MKPKSVFIGIAIVAFGLLILSITAVSAVLSASPGNLNQSAKVLPTVARFVPKQSPLFISLLVNPERLSLKAQLATRPGDRRQLNQEIQNLKQRIAQNWSLDYDRDIKSWLGEEITLAVTTVDLDREAENGSQPGYLLAMAAKAPDIAKKSIASFWQRQAIAGSDLGFEQFQGISILHTTATSTRLGLAGAMLGKFVLFANDPSVIRKAINDLQAPDLALASLDTYRQSLGKLTENRLGVAFVNLMELGYGQQATKQATSAVTADAPALPPQAALALGIGLTRSGIKAETLLWLDSLAKLPPLRSKSEGSNQALQFIPAGSAALVGRDLDQTWQAAKAILQPYPAWHEFLNGAIAKLADNSGFNLVEDVFPWIKGDYAIALTPQPTAKADPDWVLALQKANTEIVGTAIKTLDAIALTTGLTVGTVDVNHQDLTVWTQLRAASPTKLSSDSTLTGTVATVRSQTPSHAIFASSINAIEKVIGGDRDLLTKSPQFKRILAELPDDRVSFLYLDNQTNLSWLATKLSIPSSLTSPIQAAIQPALSHMQAAGMAIKASKASDPATILRGEIAITLN